MHFVRLFKIAGHLRQEFVLGDTDIYSKPQPAAHGVFDSVCQCDGIFPGRDQIAYVHICFINRSLLNLIRVFFQDGNKPGRIHAVCLEIRPDKDKLRTLLQCPHNRLSRLDMIRFRRYGLRGDDAMTCPDVPADRRRDRAKVNASRILLQLFQR